MAPFILEKLSLAGLDSSGTCAPTRVDIAPTLAGGAGNATCGHARPLDRSLLCYKSGKCEPQAVVARRVVVGDVGLG